MTHIFTSIPLQRPSTPLLDRVHFPAALRQLQLHQLPQLADELRHFLLYTVGQTGGHFGAGLGVVELTIALHYVFNTPDDRLIWDVGHQAYPHKILTNRRELMSTLRQRDGLHAFPCRSESIYDTFGVGHSSTSISAGLGMALATALQQQSNKVISIIGDGALTAGMAFEALNHAGHSKANMLVILNDNRMSISENVGGLSDYLARIWASRTYNRFRQACKGFLENMPFISSLMRRIEEHMKGFFSPGTLFEELGFNYIGPIDGHDLPKVVSYLQRIKNLPGPVFLHLVTKKGKGFAPAEADPIGYHALNKIEPETHQPVNTLPKAPKYSDVFGQWLCDMAAADSRCIGITPAMREGSGMVEFSKQFPERYFDVAIAEQHAVTLAAGLACEKMKPVVAIYSTFLQRAYDQLIHDVALQNLDVTFAIDRAGLVGEDGPTHAGSFDLSYLRCIPNMIIMAPSDENECRKMLYTAYMHEGPSAVRYPRGTGIGVVIESNMELLTLGKGRWCKSGEKIALLVFGALLKPALAAAEKLNATVIDMRFVKPLDHALIKQIAETHQLLVTLEENVIAGGAGSGVNEWLAQQSLTIATLNLGLPDIFIAHGKPSEMLAEAGLNETGIITSIQKRIQNMPAFS